MAEKKRIRKSQRNRGGYLLDRTGVGQAEIAAAIGVSQAAVAQYIKGTTKPKPVIRQAILGTYGIPKSAWDEPISQVSNTEISGTEAPATENLQPFSQTVADLTHLVTTEINRLRTNLDSNDKASDLQKLTNTLGQLGKITGEHDLNIKRILAHPDFRRAVSTITEAVRPWPEAAAAIAQALRRLEE